MKIQSSTVQEDEIQHIIQTQHVKRRGNKKKIQNAHSTHKPNIQTQCTNLRYKHNGNTKTQF